MWNMEMFEKTRSIALAAAAMASIGAVTSVQAATVNAVEVTNYAPGTGITDPNRKVTGNALGAANGNFLSLGLGGSAVFSFGTNFGSPGAVFEITNGSRSQYVETADIFGSLDGLSWTKLASITNATLSNTFTFSGVYAFLKVSDTSPAGAGRDGFDIDSISVSAVPVPAAGILLLGALGGLAAVRRRKA